MNRCSIHELRVVVVGMSTGRSRYPRAGEPDGPGSPRRISRFGPTRSGEECGALCVEWPQVTPAAAKVCERGESHHLDGLDGGTLRAQMLEPAGGRTLASAFAVSLRQLRQSCRSRLPPPSPNALPHFLHLNTAAPRETPWKSLPRDSTQPMARSSIEQMSDTAATVSGGDCAHSSAQHRAVPHLFCSCGGVSPAWQWVAA